MMARSLSEMASNVALENIDRYDKDYAKRVLVIVRKEKLDEVWEEAKYHHQRCNGKGNHIDKLWATLPCLINSLQYIKFDTTHFSQMRCKSSKLSNARFQEFIRCLGSNTPNLVELTINSPSAQEYSLAERELASILQLKNLQTLKIENVRVPLSGFSELTHRCKKLKKINATDVEIDVEPSGDVFSDTFLYITMSAFRWKQNRLGLRLESTLPDLLELKGFKQYIKLTLEPKNIAQINLMRGFTKVTEILFSSGVLEDVEKMDEFPHFPEVKIAYLYCGGKSAHALRCFLKRNGQTLQKLTLQDIHVRENMTFAEVFSFSNNLNSFEISCSSLSGNDAPVEALRQLKRFEWRYLQSEYCAPVGFSSILSAPLLEEVYIHLPMNKIDLSDSATVIDRINRREILRNIKTITMVPPRRNFYDAYNALKNAFDSLTSYNQ